MKFQRSSNCLAAVRCGGVASRQNQTAGCPLLLAVVVVCIIDPSTLRGCSGQELDGINSVCKEKCSVFTDNASNEMCMVSCRSYVELALARPRNYRDPTSTVPSTFEKLMEQASSKPGGVAAKGLDSMDRLPDRREMRGAFVRIGRPEGLVEQETGSADDLVKRRAGFVRIGRRRATEEFVRIGKRSTDDDDDADVDNLNDLDVEKRKNPAAFVRIGKARSPANFVRIGRRQNAFVRIGKAWSPTTDDDSVDSQELVDDQENDDQFSRQLRRQAFVRIGK